MGGNYFLAGFDFEGKGDKTRELVVYNLDLEQIHQAIGQNALRGSTVETVEGDGVRVDSPMDQVFAYLDDPANADVFVEAVRYRRAGK